jgi:hypothetical protein
MLTLRAQVRFNPLNVFVVLPDYALAVGSPAGALQPVDTQVVPQYSAPFKTRQGKTQTSLVGATLDATVPSEAIGQVARPVAVTLDGKEVARAAVDFSRLE